MNNTTTVNGIEIKTIDITAKQWFDKINGNSYFSAQITLNFGTYTAVTIPVPFQYGYGDSYQYEAFKQLQKLGYIDPSEKGLSAWRYYENKSIVVRNTKIEKCLKRDVIAWGA